jgi:hypothetical protein
MFVWSKRLVIGLLVGFVVMMAIFTLLPSAGGDVSELKSHTIRWMALNYVGLLIWLFVWMFDQASVRGKNVWLWLLPFLLAPLPTLVSFVLVLQRRMK